MKTLYSTILLFLGITLISNAQTAPKLDGLWADSVSGIAFKNCYAIINSDGNKINISHYLEFNNQPFAEVGTGTFEKGKLEYKVKVTLPIEGWATAGTHIFTLSADGNTLRGKYIDNKGNTGPLVLKRVLVTK